MERRGADAMAEARSWHRPLTRCECAELPFDEAARRIREDGVSLERLQDSTGLGRLCTACLPDLRAHLARFR